MCADRTRALDVGCGPGISLQWTLEYDEPYGVDVDESALAEARLRYPQVHLLRAPGEHLPFPDHYFDCIHAHLSLPYMDVAKAVREFSRVLKPEGSIHVTLHTLVFVREFWLHAVRSRCWKTGLLYAPYIVVNGLLLHLGLPQFRIPFGKRRIESFQTERGIRLALSRNGFSITDLSRSGRHFRVWAKSSSRKFFVAAR